MADFERPYYSPMDQGYHHEVQNADRRSNIEDEPIFPIHSIGQTVPEVDPSGRNRNIIEGIEAAFRGGAGNIQLVMQVPGQFQPIGGGPKEYGSEVREAIREIQKASGATITGVELPTQVNNLSGFSQHGFSEEQRKTALEEVRDSIKFVGDIAGGGGVDIVSFEFPRNFSDAGWWNKDKGRFEQRGEEIPVIVDTQTGGVQQFHPKQKFYLYMKPGTTEETPETPQEWVWNDFKKLAASQGKRAEEVFVTEYLQKQERRQIEHQRSNLTYYQDMYGDRIEEYKKMLEETEGLNKETKKAIKDKIDSYQARIDTEKDQLNLLKLEEKRIDDYKNRYKPIDTVGLQKSADSYADAGIFAMQESQKNQFVQQGKGAIYVGPEMGWPQYYGSHPQEWVELILKAREEMVEKLTKPVIEDPVNHMKVNNPYYDSRISAGEAEQLAKKHIKGELDTNHLGMWLQNFKPELPWDKRVSEFKDWYKKQIEYLAEQNKKYDVIGGVQVVDSASGAHGTLPPGQGILGKEIFDYMKILKEKGGYKGELTSEGFGEEKFGQGRIITRSWEALRSPIGSGYWDGRAQPQFRDIRTAYSQIAYGTTGIFQSYVPSNDFTLWSNVPLE